MDFAVLLDNRVKIKESEKIKKYLNLAREVRMLWKMRLKEIPIVVGALGTGLKGGENELEELEIR